MLAGKGFSNVINLSGGIKGWKHEKAFGPPDQGLSLFTGKESLETVLAVAYALEAGLEDFYRSMTPKVKSDSVRKLFEMLAAIEVKHQDRIYGIYTELADTPAERETFEKKKVAEVTEGGLTTEEYIERFSPNMESAVDILGLAMSIEAQALDLYSRAADAAKTEKSRKALIQIADEERAHMDRLAEVMEQETS